MGHLIPDIFGNFFHESCIEEGSVFGVHQDHSNIQRKSGGNFLTISMIQTFVTSVDITSSSLDAVSLVAFNNTGKVTSTVGLLLRDEITGEIFGITCCHSLYLVEDDRNMPYMLVLRQSIQSQSTLH